MNEEVEMMADDSPDSSRNSSVKLKLTLVNNSQKLIHQITNSPRFKGNKNLQILMRGNGSNDVKLDF